MSKPWAKVGAWAADAERAEEEELAAAEEAAAAAPSAASFPSLKESVTGKTKKKKVSLQEFTATSYGGGPSFESKGLTPDEMRRLPTGPKERSAEEMQYGRLGGGFSSYGRSGGMSSGPRNRDGDRDSSWGQNRRSYGGGFDDDGRGPPPRVSDFDLPSRADEVDNWASAKKRMPFPETESGRTNRYSNLGGGGDGGGFSRADEVGNWAAGKKSVPVTRSNTFGSGFRDSGREPDRWTRGESLDVEQRERRRLVLDPRRVEAVNEPVKINKASPFGAARPREEVLAEKGLDWKKLDLDIDAKKTSRPTSSHSSRPSSAQSSRSEGVGLQGPDGVAKPRLKVNPFGDAKPREVLLEEKGKDWRKIDMELEHRSIGRPETEVEKNLKEEIKQLKKEVEESSGDQTITRDLIRQKEMDLERLKCDLDDRVRFGQKVVERPGSGAGRTSSLIEKVLPQPGAFEDSRSIEIMERPRSRDSHVTGDAFSRPSDERSFTGGREKGFIGDRDIERPRSRDNRW